MAHWVNYLPEVGRPIMKLGEAQEQRCLKMRQLQNEITKLEIEFAKHKDELEKEVRKHWSREEIVAAENAMLKI